MLIKLEGTNLYLWSPKSFPTRKEGKKGLERHILFQIEKSIYDKKS